MADYDTMIIEEFRATGGHPGGEWTGIPMLLIHHHGARTGTERVTPLGCFPLGDGRFAVVAANGGSPAHPAWYHNLRARPRITVEAGTEIFPAVVHELNAAARAELWPTLTAAYPTLASHQAKTARQFPVLIVTRER